MLANTTQHDLTAKADPEQVPVVGTVVEIALIAAAMLVLNFFPEKVGIIKSLADPAGFTPLLAPEFQAHMPMLNLYWGLAFSLCVANLALGHWNIVTRGVELGISFLGLSILVRMVLGGPIALSPGVTTVIKFGLAIALIPACISIVTDIRRLAGKYTLIVTAKG